MPLTMVSGPLRHGTARPPRALRRQRVPGRLGARPQNNRRERLAMPAVLGNIIVVAAVAVVVVLAARSVWKSHKSGGGCSGGCGSCSRCH